MIQLDLFLTIQFVIIVMMGFVFGVGYDHYGKKNPASFFLAGGVLFFLIRFAVVEKPIIDTTEALLDIFYWIAFIYAIKVSNRFSRVNGRLAFRRTTKESGYYPEVGDDEQAFEDEENGDADDEGADQNQKQEVDVEVEQKQKQDA